METMRAPGHNRFSMGGARRSASIRRWLILGLSAATAMLAVGCGSSSQAPPPSEPPQSAEAEVTATPPSTEEGETESEPGGPLADVGTITGSDGKGTTFSNRYRVGPLLYSSEGTPPDEVLEACNLNYPTLVAGSVFARGQIIMTYQEGTLPTEAGLGSAETIVQEINRGEEYGEGELNSAVAFRAGNEWLCRTQLSFEFQPGESQTLPIWIIVPQVLSNAQPRLPASAYNKWYFSLLGPHFATGATGPKLTTHGPGATSCESAYGTEEQLLFLYNRSGSC